MISVPGPPAAPDGSCVVSLLTLGVATFSRLRGRFEPVWAYLFAGGAGAEGDSETLMSRTAFQAPSGCFLYTVT